MFLGLKINATISMLIAALSFSICPLLYAISIADVPAFTQAFYVQLCVSVVASIILMRRPGSFKWLQNALSDLFKLRWEVWSVIVLSGLGGYMGTLFFLWALELMSKAGASIIMEAWPLIAVFIGPAFLANQEQKIRGIDFFLMFLLLIGLIMITASDAGLTLHQVIKNPLFIFDYRGLDELAGMACAFLSALCYAWAGVSRPYFISLLPKTYKETYFKDALPWGESLFAFWLTCLTAIPLSLICAFVFDGSVFIPNNNILISLILGLCLTTMGCFYAYSLSIATSSRINLLWYTSPIMATIWLVLAGLSTLTPLLVAGGSIIILANIILILTSKKNIK